MGDRRLLFIATSLVAFLSAGGCGSSEQSYTLLRPLRRWPRHVPGGNDGPGFTPTSSQANETPPRPGSDHWCGKVYWCCYEIQCYHGDSTSYEIRTDIPLCPATLGHARNSSRYIAYDLWESLYVTLGRRLAKKKYDTKACYVNYANCREEPVGARRCGNYPED
jgi:hypothetical protein